MDQVNTATSSSALASPLEKPTLPSDVLDRIEKNRRAALLKRKQALEKQKQEERSASVSNSVKAQPEQLKRKRAKTEAELLREEELRDIVSHGQVVRVQGYKLIDTGGGFLLDEKDLIEEEEALKDIVPEPAPIIEEAPTCESCRKTFCSSFLYNTFDHAVCDTCRDSEIHTFITRTDSKVQFLLKDEDLDKREPVLKFIQKPNPHNPNRWGDMKLYLRLQVEKRALEIWESLDKIEAQRQLREENRVKTKIKKYNKKMVSLRMSARSSLYTRDLSAHTHVWDEEVYNESEDNYTHTCSDCGMKETYEKM